MQRSKLRRDSILRCADEIPYIKAHRRIKGWPLTLRNSSVRSEREDRPSLDPEERA
jgi:hypothetical protein